MAWFDKFSAFVKGAGPGFDRYQALRQLDEKNLMLQRQQEFENEIKTQQQTAQAEEQKRKLSLLDASILGEQQDQFLKLHAPGQQLEAPDVELANKVGLSPLLKQNKQNVVALPSFGEGFVDVPQEDSVQFMGTPQQQMQNKQQQQLTQAIQGLDINDPTSMMRFNALQGKPLAIGDFVQKPTGNQDMFGLNGNMKAAAMLWQQEHPNQPFTSDVLTGLIKTVGQADDRPSSAVQLTPEAIAGLGAMFRTTGVAPSFGMGGGDNRNRVYNNAFAPETNPQNVASNKARYESDKKSLANLSSTVDMLSGFEAAADKNLSVFEGYVKGLSDTNSPLLNMPVREFERVAAGDKKLAGMNAARQTALREIARVTNNPRLTGILSDDARKEVMSLIPASATIGQIYEVLGVLRKDMANVRESMEWQRAAVENRIMNIGGQPQGQGQTSPQNTPQTQTPSLQGLNEFLANKKKPKPNGKGGVG